MRQLKIFLKKIVFKSFYFFLVTISFFQISFAQNIGTEGKGIFGSECARCHSNQNIKEFIQEKWIGRTVLDFFFRE